MPDIHQGRVPLTARRAVSTFGIGVVGFMSANLVPFMIIAIIDALGVTPTEAGTIMTACLLATALTCLAVTRFTERRGRFLIARLGLALAAIGFGVAALNPAPALAIAGIVLGGIGGGGAVAAGGAALAALRNPNRMSGVSGLANRAVVTVVLAVIPIIGIGMGSAFGLLAGLAVAAFFVVSWLPAAPVVAGPVTDAASTTSPASAPPRLVTIAGFALLVVFALWALGEDSLWAMSGAIGAEQAGLSDEMLGAALSVSTGGGLLAAIALIIVGTRFGRALPLGILLAAGGALKLVAATTSDGTVYFWVLVAWNTIYAIAFMYFIATAAALDSRGRWSGPLFGAYLVGSSFGPLFGAVVAEQLGYAGLGWVLAAFSFVLLAPAVLIARLSSRVERENGGEGAHAEPVQTVTA